MHEKCLMKIVFWYIVLCLITRKIRAVYARDHFKNHGADDEGTKLVIEEDKEKATDADKANCALEVDPVNFFNTMKAIEDKHVEDVLAFEKAVVPERMNDEMLKAILNTRGVSDQVVEENYGRIDLIPAGLDLGGYCILRQNDSILFFHRLKLRNSTNFKFLYFKNDLKNLILRVKMSLNDLQLHGTYERLMTDSNPTNLFYSPTYGKTEIYLKNVEYKMEARYRMLSERLIIEVVISSLRLTEAYMVTQDADGQYKSPEIKVDLYLLEDLLDRVKTDLDSWIKDCFNDKLMNFGLADDATNARFLVYQNEKASAVNNYMQFLLNTVQDRILNLYMEAVSLPDFSIFCSDGMIFRIRNGVLRGLDTIYQRSVASAYIDSINGTLRLISGEVGFSDLQVAYTYEAVFVPGTPALTGQLILSAKDLTALFSAGIMINPNAVEFVFQSLKQLGPEALTIEGPANKILGNFQHVIQNHVLALMTYSLTYHLKNLATITDCEPNVIPYHEPGLIFHEEEPKEDNTQEDATPYSIDETVVRRHNADSKQKNMKQQSPSNDKNKYGYLHGDPIKMIRRNIRKSNKKKVKKSVSARMAEEWKKINKMLNKKDKRRHFLLGGL